MNRVKSWRLNHFCQSLVSKLNLIFVIILQLMMLQLMMLRAFNKKNALAYPWLTHFNALFVITKSCIDQQLQSMTYVSFFQTCGESIRAAFSHSKKLIGQFYSCLWNYVFLGVAFEMSVKVNPTQAKKSLFESLTLFSEMLKMNT